MNHERCGAILRVGFEHTIEHIRNGQLIAVESAHNLVPTEGLNHILNGALRAGSPTPNSGSGSTTRCLAA